MACHDKSESKRFLIVGQACLDMISIVDRFPREDEEMRAKSQRWAKGGNSANTAVVLQQTFNAPTELLCAFSQDFAGMYVRNEITKRAVTSQNCPEHATTGFPSATIMVNRSTGSRTIVYSRNNLPELSFVDFDMVDLDAYMWVHFEARYNIDEIVKMVKKIGNYNRMNQEERIQVSIELEKRRENWQSLINIGVNYIFMSKDFAQQLGYCTPHGLLDYMKNETNATLICAWGEKGAYALDFAARCAIIHAEAHPPERLLDTLGAGDTFNAAVIYYLAQKRPLNEAVVFGCKLAGRKCGIDGFDGLTIIDL